MKLGLPVLGAIPLGLPSGEAVVDGVLYAGTLMSAISGVISAGTKQMDMLGCIIVGCITAMAGGTLRDVVLNRPPFWITYPSHLHAAVWGSLATFVLWPLIINHSAFKDTHLAFLWSDAIGMASSTVVGTEIGFAETGQWQAAVTTGLVTATFGGIMRDVLCLDPPRALYAERSMCAAPRRAQFGAARPARHSAQFLRAQLRATRRNSARNSLTPYPLPLQVPALRLPRRHEPRQRVWAERRRRGRQGEKAGEARHRRRQEGGAKGSPKGSKKTS